MNRREQSKKNNRKLFFMLMLLLAFGIGLGYAVLTEQLSINNTVKYGSMKWNVGFVEVDGTLGSVTAVPSLSTDKKTITVTCDLGISSASETCIVEMSFDNDSSFAVKLSSNPTVTFDNTYISSVLVQDVTGTAQTLAKDYSVPANGERTFRITVTTKELTEDLLPSTALSVPVNVTLDWVEA